MSYRDAIIEQVQHLPPMPQVAVRLSSLLKNPEVSASELVQTVKYDLGLTARIIQMSNSAYVGGGERIKNLNDALVRLGNKQIFSFVISSAVQPMMTGKLDGYGLEGGEMWRHSVAVAVAAELIVEVVGGVDKETAFTAGMLHDIGKLAMDSFVGKEADSLTSVAHSEQRSFQHQEAEVLGMNHNEAGAELLKQWGLPDEHVAVARWHHDPEHAESDQHLVDVIHLADTVSMSLGLGIGDDGLCYTLNKNSFGRLKVDEKMLQRISAATLSKLELVQEMFKIENGGPE